MLNQAFVGALSARRVDYNAQFLAARRASPELDEEAFKVFLSTSVDPVISAVAALDPTAVVEVVDTAYGIGLELLSQRLAGPRASSPALDTGFQQLFPALARFIARAPNVVLPRLCNALHQLATVPGVRSDEWCSAMARLAPSVESIEHLLALGQVLAWLAGLAHYRAGSLALCRSLPAPLVASALGVPGADVPSLLARLEQDPWFVPSAPGLGFRLVGSVGSFRGFGGAFLAPPRVARVDQQLFVISGNDAWLLTLDAFGCTLHRARPEDFATATSDVQRAVSVEPTRVNGFGKSLPLRDTGSVTSAVGNATTLLFTTSHSYAVAVVALEGAP
jgi:hypothetical protein